MSEWIDLGLPSPLVNGFTAETDFGLLRTPFSTALPEQAVNRTSRRRSFGLSFALTGEQLALAESFIHDNGFSGFSLPLPGETCGVETMVRLTDNYQVSVLQPGVFRLTCNAETLVSPVECTSYACNETPDSESCSCDDLPSGFSPFIFIVDHTGDDYTKSSGWVIFKITEGTTENYNFCVEWGDGTSDSYTESSELTFYYNNETGIWNINSPESGEEIFYQQDWIICHHYSQPGEYTIKLCGECGAPHFGFDYTGGESSPLFDSYIPRFPDDEGGWIHFPLPNITITQWGVLKGAYSWSGAFANRSVESIATDGLGYWLSEDDEGLHLNELAIIDHIFYHDGEILVDYVGKVDVTNWSVGSYGDWSGAFTGMEITGGSLSNWDASQIYNMEYMLKNCVTFDQDLSCWDVQHLDSDYGDYSGFADNTLIIGTAKMPKWGQSPNTGCG